MNSILICIVSKIVYIADNSIFIRFYAMTSEKAYSYRNCDTNNNDAKNDKQKLLLSYDGPLLNIVLYGIA